MTLRLVPVVVALAIAATLGSSAGCAIGFGRGLVIASGEEATGEAAAGYALARLLRDRSQMDVTAAATGGVMDNLARLRDGSADFALVTADALADAVNGQGAFQGGTVPARTIATLSDACLQLVVLQDSPISGLSGLRGRKVSTGPMGSATELTALRVLREALLDPQRDLIRQSLPLPAALSALTARRIDALFWNGVIPVHVIEQASRGATGFRVVSTASVVPLLKNRFGEALYQSLEFPSGAYGSSEPFASAAVAVILVARADLPDQAARLVARELAEQAGALRAAHPLFRGMMPARARQAAPAALHPGAAQYYRDITR